MNTKPPRAWHKKKKKMYRVAIVDFRTPIGRKTGGHCQCIGEADRWEYPFEVILLWPIGTLDKNGTGIYGGDVVKYVYQPGKGYWNSRCTGVINWNSTGWHFKPIGGGFSGWLVSMPGAGQKGNNEVFEVIGNIYQHPDLLKKE